jgi:hypothetical protein
MKAVLPPLLPVEETQLRCFREFYESLPEKENVFYMFFTSGLLHWVIRSSRLASQTANVVLIGSGLQPEELSWLERYSEQPFHHLIGPADDKTVWELLFRTNRYSFGWIDIDCFVLSPELLSEMMLIDERVVANCVWSLPRHGRHILSTYLLFLNAAAIREVIAQVPVTPCTYSYERTSNSRTVSDRYCRMLTPVLAERLGQILPVDDAGRPRYLGEDNFFDTLHVYQLVAETLGYRLGRVRPLRHENTDEVVHVGKVSYYEERWSGRDLPENQIVVRLLLQMEYLMLQDLCGRLPIHYELRRQRLAAKLGKLGVPSSAAAMRESLFRMAAISGTSERALARMVDGWR